MLYNEDLPSIAQKPTPPSDCGNKPSLWKTSAVMRGKTSDGLSEGVANYTRDFFRVLAAPGFLEPTGLVQAPPPVRFPGCEMNAFIRGFQCLENYGITIHGRCLPASKPTLDVDSADDTRRSHWTCGRTSKPKNCRQPSGPTQDRHLIRTNRRHASSGGQIRCGISGGRRLPQARAAPPARHPTTALLWKATHPPPTDTTVVP